MTDYEWARRGAYMPWLHSLTLTHSCFRVLYEYSYLAIAHPLSLSLSYINSHHQSQWILTHFIWQQRKEYLSFGMALPHPSGSTASRQAKQAHAEHQAYTPSSHKEGEKSWGVGQASGPQQGGTISIPETIAVPDIKRLCCLFSTFLLLPSPREVSEIKNLECLLVMAVKVGAFHRVPLASLSGSEERRSAHVQPWTSPRWSA